MSSEYKVYAYQHHGSWAYVGTYASEPLPVEAIAGHADEAATLDDGSKYFSVAEGEAAPGDAEYQLPEGAIRAVCIQ